MLYPYNGFENSGNNTNVSLCPDFTKSFLALIWFYAGKLLGLVLLNLSLSLISKSWLIF